MAVIKIKPTSPGRRGVVKVTRDHLHKGEGYAPLLEPQHQKSGRNNNGHITTRHKGEEVIPARARPVPFCLKGFLVEW